MTLNQKATSGLHFFNLDLHISVIADVKDIFENIGHKVTDWTISGHAWVFGRKRKEVEVVNQDTWLGLDKEMCDRFYEHYSDFLHTFDGFIVTHNASFSLLYERVEKPIIIVNTTRYENPFTRDKSKLKWLNEYLIEGVKSKQIYVISNNKGDDYYLGYFTGIKSKVIPSLCLYTKGNYSGKKKKFILVSRLKKIIMSKRAEIVNAMPDKFGFFRQFKTLLLNIIQDREPDIRSPTLRKLVAYKEKALRTGYKWQALYDFKGIIHIPYQISKMSIFEEYSANVPLFFPSKKFLFKLHKTHPDKVLCELSFYQINKLFFNGDDKNSPNNIESDDILKRWIDLADYYDEHNMPYINYFDSFEHLEELLLTVDCDEVSKKMREFNKERRQRVYNDWQNILSSIKLN